MRPAGTPIEPVEAAAEVAELPVLTPRPGESVQLADAPPMVRWWPPVPWTRGNQHSIVATRMRTGRGSAAASQRLHVGQR